MRKIVVYSIILAFMFAGCSNKEECCPGYESVKQPDKCVKIRSECEDKKNSYNEEVRQPKSAPIVIKKPVEQKCDEPVLREAQPLLISVVGQGVAPINTASPAQAYALAKRAAIADAYRLIAEKVKGVRVDGQDLIKNMMVKRSTVRTSVNAMVRNAKVVETTFKEGLCEVEMEIVLSYSNFSL
ncbi:MAG: LPP20 family lipoprotein [Campylobacterota bacterium]|nr:LPP20 family lipoprotein [Campylobacterota bacterium]